MTENSYSKHIKEAIKRLREQRDWKQSDLANKAKLSQGAISQIESGNRKPTLLVLKKIATAFGVSIEELIGEPIYSNITEKKYRNFYNQYKRIESLSAKDRAMIVDMIKRLGKKAK